MKNKLFSKITIVIITYERLNNLNLLLEYFDKTCEGIEILILDSSKNNNKKKIFKNKFNIVRYCKFNNSTFLAKKINTGLRLVNTPYSVICADDDFLIVSTLNLCANFLNKNPTYISAMGYHYSYDFFYLEKFKKIFFTILNYSTKGNSLIFTKLRLEHYINRKNDLYTFYALHKTNELKKIWKYVSFYMNDYHFIEFCSNTLSLLLGKAKVFNKAYLIRAPNTKLPKSIYQIKRRDVKINLVKYNNCVNNFSKEFKIKLPRNFILNNSIFFFRRLLINKNNVSLAHKIKSFLKVFLYLDYFILNFKLIYKKKTILQKNVSVSQIVKILIKNHYIKNKEINKSRDLY